MGRATCHRRIRPTRSAVVQNVTPRRRRRRARRVLPRAGRWRRPAAGPRGPPPRDGLVRRERPAGERPDRPDRDDPALPDVAGDRLEQIERGPDPAERPGGIPRSRQHQVQPIPGPRRGLRPALGSSRTPSSTADRPRPIASRSFPPRTKPRAPRYSATTRGDERRRAFKAAAGGCRRADRSCTGSCSSIGAAAVRCSARLTLRVPRAHQPDPGTHPIAEDEVTVAC